jgi:hypothetical protein
MKRFAKIGLGLAFVLVGLFLAMRLLEFASGFKTTAESDVSLNVGKTESRSNVSSSTTTVSSDNSGFNSRRVLFINGSTHPFSQRIGNLVVERLKNFPQIEQVEVANSRTNLFDGAEAPDLFLRMELVELKEGGVLTRSLQATLTASLGNAPWKSSHDTSDATSPPLVKFAWNATVENETTFSGIRTDRYAAAVENIADELTKGVSNQLQSLSAKFPPLPALPLEFYGPYQPVSDFDFLKEVLAQRMDSYHGLLTHNETFWKFETTTNPLPQLQRIISLMEAAQWKGEYRDLTNTYDHYLSFRRDGEELEIFRQRDETAHFSLQEKPPTPLQFIAHYRKPFTKTEREAALEMLFAQPNSLENLLPFQNLFSSGQRERFYALLEKTPVASPRACLQLAEHYLHRKQTNDAVNMLIRAKALTATLNDYSTVESDIAAMAKKISPKKTLKLEVTPDAYRDLGFLEITNGPQTFELERAPGQPVLLFTTGVRGPVAFCLNIRPPQKDSYPWMLIESREGSRTSSSSNFTVPGSGKWEHSFTYDKLTLKFSAQPQPVGKRIKIFVRTGL